MENGIFPVIRFAAGNKNLYFLELLIKLIDKEITSSSSRNFYKNYAIQEYFERLADGNSPNLSLLKLLQKELLDKDPDCLYLCKLLYLQKNILEKAITTNSFNQVGKYN